MGELTKACGCFHGHNLEKMHYFVTKKIKETTHNAAHIFSYMHGYVGVRVVFCLPDFLCILNFKCYSPLTVHTQSYNVDIFFKEVVFQLKLKGHGSLFSRRKSFV